MRDGVLVIHASSCCGVRSGRSPRRRAAMPEMMGAAKEVPERRSGFAAAIVIARRDRRAEDLVRRREHFQSTAARTGPPAVLFRHSADRDDPLDPRAEDGREAIDDTVASAAAVEIVAGDDERGTSCRIHRARRADRHPRSSASSSLRPRRTRRAAAPQSDRPAARGPIR